jgi:hypothetical protein
MTYLESLINLPRFLVGNFASGSMAYGFKVAVLGQVGSIVGCRNTANLNVF